MIQRLKLLRDMRSCAVSSDSTGTSFLVPLTIESVEKLNGSAYYQSRGVLGAQRVGDSEKIRSITKSRSSDNDISEVHSNNVILLKQFAADNAALRLKLQAIANERNQYRDQFLAGVQEASRRSLMNGASCPTHLQEVTLESLVENQEAKIDEYQNRGEELTISNDLLELKRAAAVVHEKELSQSKVSKSEMSANIKELRALCAADSLALKNVEVAARECQMKEMSIEFEKRMEHSVKDWTLKLEEANILREKDKQDYIDKLTDLNKELEHLRAVTENQRDPWRCEKSRDQTETRMLLKSLQADHLSCKKSTVDMMESFNNFLHTAKEDMALEIRHMMVAKDAKYALNLNLKDLECQNLRGRMKVLDGLLSVAQTSKLKILCQVRNLSECASTGITEIAEMHVQVVQSVQHDSHRKGIDHNCAMNRVTIERDRAVDELNYFRYLSWSLICCRRCTSTALICIQPSMYNLCDFLSVLSCYIPHYIFIASILSSFQLSVLPYHVQ
jgi:hypothetical protein